MEKKPEDITDSRKTDRKKAAVELTPAVIGHRELALMHREVGQDEREVWHGGARPGKPFE